jgi:hypothetical protein
MPCATVARKQRLALDIRRGELDRQLAELARDSLSEDGIPRVRGRRRRQARYGWADLTFVYPDIDDNVESSVSGSG